MAFSFSYSQSFVKIYPGIDLPAQGIYINSVPNCLEKTNDGGFLIGGYTTLPDSIQFDYMQLRKVDAQGNIEWEKIDRLSGVSMIRDVVEGADNSIYTAVYNNGDPTVVKRNQMGEIVWVTNLIPTQDSCGEVYRIIKTSDGNLAVCGVQTDCLSSLSADGFILKIDTNGAIIWKAVIAYPLGNDFRDVIESNDSTLIVVGSTEEIGSGVIQGLTKIFLCSVKNNTGNVNWYKTYGAAHVPFSMVKLGKDSVVVGGGVFNNGTHYDGFLFLTNINGDSLSINSDTLPSENSVRRVAYKEGMIHSLQYWSPYDTLNQWYYLVLRVQQHNSNLGLTMSKTFDDFGSHQSMDMEVLDDGRIAVAFF